MAKKILIIDDSALMRRIFCDIIKADNRFEVTDIAKDGVEGIALLANKSYDAVILDINMPKMNGIEVLQEIRRQHINVTVVVASTYTKDGEATLKCLELGAVDFIQKPLITRDTKTDTFRNLFMSIIEAAASINTTGSSNLASPVNLTDKAKQASRAKKPSVGVAADDKRSKLFIKKSLDKALDTKSVSMADLSRGVKTDSKSEPKTDSKIDSKLDTKLDSKKNARGKGGKLVAICTSTGGPQALKAVIPLIPANIGVPVLVVQHMPSGFTKSLAERLNDISKITVCEAEQDQELKKNCVYIARGGNHLKIKEENGVRRIIYTDEPPREGVKPCANYMYESLIDTSFDDITCVVLTGMGKDGCEGIKNLVSACPDKKVFVIAQSKETSTVYGMPRAVDLAGLTNESVDISQVTNEIIMNVGVK